MVSFKLEVKLGLKYLFILMGVVEVVLLKCIFFCEEFRGLNF